MAPPIRARSMLAGILLAMVLPAAGLRASEELSGLLLNSHEDVSSERNEGLLAVVDSTDATMVGRTVKCNIDVSDSIMECGDSVTCSGSCTKQQEIDIAGVSVDDACSTSWLRLYSCVATAYSLKRQPVHIPGRGQSYCCLCPLGKVFDIHNGWCVTGDLTVQQLPCSRLGSCSDERQMLDLAGSSPEAACRTRWLFVTSCPATARSEEREAVAFPEVFPDETKVYCCICPENSVYNSVEGACVCRVADTGMERILPKNGRCPTPGKDTAVALKAEPKTEDERVAPAMKQIEWIRTVCLNHRFVDEIVDPKQYKDVTVRMGLGGDLALAIDKITILKFDALIKFDEEEGGAYIDFEEDLVLEVGLGSVTVFKGGTTYHLPTSNGNFAVDLRARIAGKEMLSRVVEFGVGGHLKSSIDTFDINLMGLDMGVTALVKQTIEDKVLGGIFGNLFWQIGYFTRGVSVEGPLSAAMQGRDIYPIRLRTSVDTACVDGKLCLALDFQVSQKQDPRERSYGLTFSTIDLSTGVENNKAFWTRLNGKAKLDIGAALDQVFNEQTQYKIDVAYGNTKPEKPKPETVESEVAQKKRQEAMLKRSEVCKARMDDWDLQHKSFLMAVSMGGSVKRYVTDAAGSAYSLYSSWFPPYPAELKVNATPGPERGDMEAGLMAAWQELHPTHKGIFERSQAKGEEPWFGVTALQSLAIDATGQFKVNRVGGGVNIGGVLQLHSLVIKNFRKDACTPTDHLTQMEEFRSCWHTGVTEDLDVALAPTSVAVSAELMDDGDLTACVQMKDLQIISNYNFVAQWLGDTVASVIAVKRMVEDALEAQVADTVYKIFASHKHDALTSGTLDLTLKPGDVTFDLRLNAPWQSVGKLQAKGASVPPKLSKTGSTQSGIGSAWDVLREQMGSNDQQVDPKLAGAQEKYTYDPQKWLAMGYLSVASELVDEMSLTGKVDFEMAAVPVSLNGRIQINLNDLVHAKVNDHGVKDLGQYKAAAHVLKVRVDGSWKEMEAVVSCGYMFLSGVVAGKDHFRITHEREARYAHQIDITRSREMARRDGKDSFFDFASDASSCSPGVAYAAAAVGGSELEICVPQDTFIAAALAFEQQKRGLMNSMILEQGYEADMLWSPLKVDFKSAPFSWIRGGADHSDIVSSSCRNEVQRCARAIQCMGVRYRLGECDFLSVYDVQGSVLGSYIKKEYHVGLPQTWGAE